MKFMKGCFTLIGLLAVVMVVLGFFAALGNRSDSLSTSSSADRALVPTYTPTGTVSESSPTVALPTPTSPMLFTRENWSLLDTDPDAYGGARVEIVGRVFGKVERDAEATMWQMWSDPVEIEWNTLVMLRDPLFKLNDGDYVRVVGSVRGGASGDNAFGGRISAVVLDAELAEVVDGLAAASPPVRTVAIDQAIDQHGLIVRVVGVDYANDETRVRLVVFNGSANNAHIFRHNAKAVQGSTQFETDYNSMYPELLSEMLPNIESQGVYVFPRMDSTLPTTLYIEAYTDDYSLDFTQYIFEIPVP